MLDHAPAPVPADLSRRYLAHGFHTSASFPALIARAQREFGSLPAVLDGEVELSWGELMGAAQRVAGFLRARGVVPGDTVVWQLPNWWETFVVAYGIWAAGAVSSPVVPMYREHELARVVAAVRPAAVITAAAFHGTRHVDVLEAACATAGWSPPVRVVVRGPAGGWTALEDVLAGGSTGSRPPLEDVAPGAPALVGWTSGTTSGSKGVVHSTQSLLAFQLTANRGRFRYDDRGYMPAPIAHATGLSVAVGGPLLSGASVVVRDHWDPELAVDDMLRTGTTYSSGAPVFVQELVEVLAGTPGRMLPLRAGYICGGATVSADLMERGERAGLRPTRSYGMTECPGVSFTPHFESEALRHHTDGLLTAGNELRVVDRDGRDLPPGQEGELVVRGAQRALGYLSPEDTADAFGAEGWFRSGDLGIWDERTTTLSVTGRVKDIINRGGEKISAREIEDLLDRHPAVLESAVVAVPHARLGEQPAAFLRLRPGVAAEGADLAAYLQDAGLAKQKTPTSWRFVTDFPRTASGKVQKQLLAGLP